MNKHKKIKKKKKKKKKFQQSVYFIDLIFQIIKTLLTEDA